MNHLLLGSVIGLIPCLLWYTLHGYRASRRFLIITPCIMALTAVWAVIPDIPRILGLHRAYLAMMNDPRCDIFFWHYTIDRIECDNIPYHIGWTAIGAALLLIAWRELFMLERERNERNG